MFPDEDLIDLIYAALLGEQPWQAFLDKISGSLPDGKAVFFLQGLGSRTDFSALHSGMDLKDLTAYAQHYAAINPWIPVMARLSPGTGVSGHKLYPVEKFANSEIYNDYFKKMNVETSGGLVIEQRLDMQFNLTFMSSQTDHAVTEARAAQLDRISPHLRRASNFYRGDDSGNLANEFGASLLDSLDIGVVILKHGPKIGLVSRAAREINAAFGFYRVNPIGTVRLSAADADDTLRDMLGKTYEGPKLRTILSGRLSLTLIRIEREGLSGLLQGPSVVVLTEVDRHFRIARTKTDIQRQYGLTRAELRVLSGLLDGLSLAGLSRQVGLSHETLRTQQRSLFEKLEVSSQIQLLNRVYRDGRIEI